MKKQKNEGDSYAKGLEEASNIEYLRSIEDMFKGKDKTDILQVECKKNIGQRKDSPVSYTNIFSQYDVVGFLEKMDSKKEKVIMTPYFGRSKFKPKEGYSIKLDYDEIQEVKIIGSA